MMLSMYSILLCFVTLYISLLLNLVQVDAKKNLIKMNVYYEPQDGESTRFFKEELLPLLDTGILEFVDLKLVPFGRSTCNPAHQEYECSCPNGEAECELMHLMSCALHDYRNHVNSLELIACIQGQSSLADAQEECVKKLPIKEVTWLSHCPNEFRGKYLSWVNGLRTKALGFKLPTVPTIVLNGELNLEASFGLKLQLCNLLKDKNLDLC